MGDIIWSLYGTFIHSVCYKIKSNRHGKKKKKEEGQEIVTGNQGTKTYNKSKVTDNPDIEIR